MTALDAIVDGRTDVVFEYLAEGHTTSSSNIVFKIRYGLISQPFFPYTNFFVPFCAG